MSNSSTSPVEIRVLSKDDLEFLLSAPSDVFDDQLHPQQARAFLADDHHHLVVATSDDTIVGFVSAVHYLHPDKSAAELWINEVGVTESFRRLGVARAMLYQLQQLAHTLGCSEMWVLTEDDNAAALGLYGSVRGSQQSHAVLFTLPVETPSE